MIYFDNSATGFPKSGRVFDAMAAAFFGTGNAGRSGHSLARAGAETLFRCRTAVAGLFDCDVENVVLTKNATEALNYAVKGLARQNSDVVCSSLEHNAVVRSIYALAGEGVRLKPFTVDFLDDDKTVSNFISALTPRCSLAVVTHASNVCGRILPVERMAIAAAARGIPFVLDASQTAGHFPISMRMQGLSVLCSSGHKGLYGPMGTGILVTSPNSHLHFKTIIEGGTGVRSFDKEMPPFLPERLEAGTLSTTAFAGLAAAVEELEYDTNAAILFRRLVNGLAARPDITLYGEPQGNYEQYVPVVLFNKQGIDCEQLAADLNEKDIAVRPGYHCSPFAHRALGTTKIGGVRVSLGRANTTEEVAYFLNVL